MMEKRGELCLLKMRGAQGVGKGGKGGRFFLGGWVGESRGTLGGMTEATLPLPAATNLRHNNTVTSKAGEAGEMKK